MVVGPTMRRRRLGADLRRLREGRSLRLDEVAGRLGVVASTLSRIETGKAPTRAGYLSIMLDLYGVTDVVQRQALAELAREGQRKGWWAECEDVLPAGGGTYLGLEADALAIRVFAVQVVPGLVQTPDYARAVIAAGRPELSAVQADRLVCAQLRRQEVLGEPAPAEFRLVLDESVLLRRVGSRAVMAGQLRHLAGLAGHPAVTLQVLGLAADGRPVPPGSFSVLSFAEPGDADVACGEGLRGQVLLADRDADVRPVRAMFDALSACALPAERSARLIADLMAGA